jgi:hypothetical protein
VDRQERPPLAGRREITADQVAYPVNGRPGEVGHAAGRSAHRQVDQPGRHVAGVHRLEPQTAGDRHYRQLCHPLHQLQSQIVELRGPQRRPRHTRFGHRPLGGQLRPQPGQRHPIGTDD